MRLGMVFGDDCSSMKAPSRYLPPSSDRWEGAEHEDVVLRSGVELASRCVQLHTPSLYLSSHDAAFTSRTSLLSCHTCCRVLKGEYRGSRTSLGGPQAGFRIMIHVVGKGSSRRPGERELSRDGAMFIRRLDPRRSLAPSRTTPCFLLAPLVRKRTEY